jgi:hypothetical protein
MKIRISLLLTIAILLSSCEIPGAVISTPIQPSAAQPTIAPGCISPQPTQDDIERALTYTDDIFSGGDWARSYTVEANRVSVTYTSGSLNALAFVEALIFDCGYGDPELDTFFSAENWNIIFTNYESYQHAAECKSKDALRLYQFTAIKDGFNYAINYWALKDTGARVMEMMIVFPSESKSLMDEYSSALFPELTSCK